MDGQSQNVETSVSGSFNDVKFDVPFSSQNSELEIKAEGGGQTAKAFLSVGGYYPNVTPSAWYVVRGGSVNFSGQGFAPNETVKVKANGEDRGEVVSNSNGKFTSPNYSLPFVGGAVSFSFTGVLSQKTSERTVHVAKNQPHVILNSYYLPGGSNAEIKGYDFGANESISIFLEGVKSGVVSTNQEGYFSTVISLPISGAGKKTIMASGVFSGLSSSAIVTTSN